MALNPLLADHVRDGKEEAFLGRSSLNTPKWWRNCLEPTSEWSGRQHFWIWQSTVLTCWVSFGVSYAVTYLLIAGQPKPDLNDMLLNYFGTAIITPLLNWIIGGSLMTVEIMIGRVAVIDPRSLSWWPDESHSDHSEPFTGKRWWLTPSDIVLEPSYYPKSKTCGGCLLSFLQRLSAHLIRAIPWILMSITLTVPVMYGISILLYGQDNYNAYPQPQIMLSVQTLSISLLTMPLWTRIALANMGSKLVHDETYLDFINDIDPVGFNIA